MKIKEGFQLRNVCGENVIVATGLKNIDFSKVISLNESAALLWRAVCDKDFTPEDLADALMGEYDVDREQALADAKEIAANWVEIGVAE